jgi:hypothetical protein
MLFFFRKSTTRSYYLMHFSQRSLRGAESWHIWKQHHVIECFWKIMQSIFQIRLMHLQGDGLYTALLIKVFAYLLALRLQAQRVFSKLTSTRSGCQNIKLAIASYDGVPCRNGNTDSLTLRHLGTDTPRSTGLYSGS